MMRSVSPLRYCWLASLLLAPALVNIAPACAQDRDYPLRPVRVIVPFPPGGPTDVLARAIGVKLTKYWGQQVIVDNRPGAGGNIVMQIASRASPDGYTLVMGTIATRAINESLYKNLPFSPQA